ncbi:MAG: zinc ribbon domain-containing protein [Anaerolineales bacterium]|nr:zinc ribbon domain-containing protein [Anaerolineales bacterium]
MEPIVDFSLLNDYLVYLSAFLGAFLVALWISLCVWTFRDIRSRSRDRLIQVLSILIVAIFTILGLIIYLILRPRQTLDEAYQQTLEEEALLTEIETRSVCPGCGAETKHDWQVCPHCHTQLQKVCTNCGRLMELPWQICPYCATPAPGSKISSQIADEVIDLPEEQFHLAKDAGNEASSVSEDESDPS